MKIIHVADVHIGMEFGVNKIITRKRQQEILNGFLSIVDFAVQNLVDVFLIAGDLFDNEGIDAELVNKIADKFESAQDVMFFVAPGNHDCLSGQPPYNRKWSKNVCIFADCAKIEDMKSKGYRVWGRGFSGPFCTNGMLKGVNMPEDDIINLAVLHGEVIGNGGNSDYNPIRNEDIERSNIDYLALGHIHQRSEVSKLGNTYFSYSGTPQGQGFDETGIKGFYYGEITKENMECKVNLDFVPLHGRRYEEYYVDISGCTSGDEIVEKTKEFIYSKALASQDDTYENNLYKLTLIGEVNPVSVSDISYIKNQLEKELFFVKIRDKSRHKADYESLAKENNLKGRFVLRMLGQIEEAKKAGDYAKEEDYLQALELGLCAFFGVEDTDED